MYSFLLKIFRPSIAKIITAIWYVLLIMAIFLVSHHSGNGDFLYLHL